MPLQANAVDRLVERIQINIGRGVGAQAESTISDYTLEWVNLIQKEICNMNNFWFMEASTTGQLLVGEDTEALPSDFKDEDILSIVDANGNFTELTLMDKEDYRRFYSDNTATSARGEPTHYIIRETDIFFRPKADKTYNLILDYWKYLADMTAAGTATTLLTKYPNVLEYGATFKGFQYLGELENAQYWLALYQKEIADMMVANADRMLPDEMGLSVRTGAKSSAISKKRNRTGYWGM